MLSPSSALIAIVDDEEAIRRALLRLLRSAGLDAQAFASGIEFLDSLRQRVPECLVLDLHMPSMNGFEVQAELALGWPALPVIMVTGHHSAESHAKASGTTAVAYLLKPIDDRLLLAAIGEALLRPLAAKRPT